MVWTSAPTLPFPLPIAQSSSMMIVYISEALRSSASIQGSLEMTPIHIPSWTQSRPSICPIKSPIPSPPSPLERPPEVRILPICEYRPGAGPYPSLRLPRFEVVQRPSPLLQNQEVVFLENHGVVKLVETDATCQWVVYRCLNERLNIAERVIIAPRKWVIRTHWDRIKVRFRTFLASC